VWLSHWQAPPWGGAPWAARPWGGGGPFGGWGPGWMGPGMMRGYGGPGAPGGWGPWSYEKKTFKSNGERIYYSGISAKDGPIPIAGGPMWLQMGPVGCVACHGPSGRGGVPIMMGTAIPEDIRYTALTSSEHQEEGEKKEEMDHPPYTDATIRRAITQGVDPAGKPLDWTMPRWQMSDQDLNDVIAYLKTLK
jgi:cytochrome c oxidase subunit 2